MNPIHALRLVAAQPGEQEADHLDQLEPHPPEQATVILHLTHDVVLQLGASAAEDSAASGGLSARCGIDRTSYDVWLDLHTGEGRLRRQTR